MVKRFNFKNLVKHFTKTHFPSLHLVARLLIQWAAQLLSAFRWSVIPSCFDNQCRWSCHWRHHPNNQCWASITEATILATGVGGLITKDTTLAMVTGATISAASFGGLGPVIGPPVAVALVA